MIQNVGFGTDFPDPDADPFCVEFDKRRQNFTEFGIVDFLAQEPARVAAAVAQVLLLPARSLDLVGRPGGRARPSSTTGTGATTSTRRAAPAASYVENFTFNNQTGDPRLVPGLPGGVEAALRSRDAAACRRSTAASRRTPAASRWPRRKNVYAKHDRRAGGGRRGRLPDRPRLDRPRRAGRAPRLLARARAGRARAADAQPPRPAALVHRRATAS